MSCKKLIVLLISVTFFVVVHRGLYTFNTDNYILTFITFIGGVISGAVAATNDDKFE